MANADPLEWDQQISRLSQFVHPYRQVLKLDPTSADPSGPFVGVPYLTTRSAFADIRALPDSLPVRQPLLRWAYQLADVRMNAELERAIAITWRSQVITRDRAHPQHTTRAELLERLLSDPSARQLWWSAIEQHSEGLSEGASLLWQRREEIAKRAGFEDVSAALDPMTSTTVHVDRWLVATEAIRTPEWPKDPLSFLRHALAPEASEGWPAHVNAQSLVALLGQRAWLARPMLSEPSWPRLIGPTSFVRALYELGRALASAWAPNGYPFVLAHDAGRLAEHRLGWLIASLGLNIQWQQRILGINRDRARSQVRTLTRALLLRARLLCVKLQLRPAAVKSASVLKSAFGETTLQRLGFELADSLAGVLPRLDVDDGQRLLGFWMGCSDHARQRHRFDQDWFRDPRAIESLLEDANSVRDQVVEASAIERHQADARIWLNECLQAD